MQVLKILTYNVCFGCMIGSEEDKSALPLARRCATSLVQHSPTQCLLQVVRNIDKAADISGGLDVIGLQEASAWSEIQLRSRELADKTAIVTKVGQEELVLFVGRTYHVQWSGSGSVSGRPLQVVRLRHILSGCCIILVHFHNNHMEKGTDALLQQAIADVVDINSALVNASKCTVICMGDWNDSYEVRNGFRPFSLCVSPSNVKNITVSTGGGIPKSCCSTKSKNKHMRFVSDYVLSNKRCQNDLPLDLLVDLSYKDASDHYAIRAIVETRNIAHPLFHFLCEI